ncbi:TadE/TadG family type IV pilus assembly protein [Cellulomonas edaphi]|uniref:Pilus assembly protein TadG-related protein n=1 Tax=Cellulomonas edaphi TaxID=3053468 RepID=A0ABT7S6K7_9CELL|nr:pilus assembly protein TadG-related protein [Cellulomons edaphi]MDM7831252.1 pilus assembly protein TadG-related protein [Cellulomons edaphi]
MSTVSTLTRRLRAEDTGTMSVFVIGLIVVLMALAGLVVDGGRAINARATAADDAEQAARAGANQVDDVALRGRGTVVVDEAAAREAALSFLSHQGYDRGDVRVAVRADSVDVSVSDDVPTTLLSLVNIDTFHVTGSATARATVGIINEIGGAP